MKISHKKKKKKKRKKTGKQGRTIDRELDLDRKSTGPKWKYQLSCPLFVL